MKKYTWFVYMFMALFIWVTPVLAAGIVIDGNFADWADKAFAVDPGGKDDESSPARADITEFRVHADINGLYILNAWDNTSFTGGNASTAGITLRTASGAYYRFYSTAQDTPGTVPTSSLDVNLCADSTCQSQTDVCTGTACTGAQLASGTTWADPYATRLSPVCSGTNCGTLDTAVEMFVPWSLIGGLPSNGSTMLLDFGSYPSGPAQAPKDTSGSLSCTYNNGMFNCFDPTAATLGGFSTAASQDKIVVSWDTMLESDMIGFNIYRSTDPGTHGARLNDEILFSQSPGGLLGATYTFTDTSVSRGATYYYWLEVVDTNGSTFYGPQVMVLQSHVFLPIISK